MTARTTDETDASPAPGPDASRHPHHEQSTTRSNNGTERDIRMAKLKQKVSGGLRTMTGARQFCAIRSYLSTAAKHNLNFFDALVMLTNGKPWMPATT